MARLGLDNPSVVDAVGTDRKSGEIVLTIADSWNWDDSRAHLLALQEKINSYLGFVESGEIYDAYPSAVGQVLRIEIVSRYAIPEVGLAGSMTRTSPREQLHAGRSCSHAQNLPTIDAFLS